MTRHLVVNADDFGRSRGVSAGIVEAHLHGLVSTTTGLMNLPGATADVAQASRQAPRLGLGVHLNLTLGSPLSPPAAVPDLVAAQGRFWPPDELALRSAAIDPAQVAREWRAQIEAFLATGAALDHLDSHHHVALYRPAWWSLCLDLAHEHGCGVRPAAPADPADVILFSRFPRAAQRYAAAEAGALCQARGVFAPHRLVTRFFGPAATPETLSAILEGLPEGSTELMCHPGRMDSILASESGYGPEREAELAVLTSDLARRIVTRRDLHLTTYRFLAASA